MFVDYLEQHGEILSANQFADIPVIQRPQGMTEIKEALAPNNIEKTDKIRTKERKIKEPKNKNKPSMRNLRRRSSSVLNNSVQKIFGDKSR